MPQKNNSRISIKECGEPLVDIKKYCPGIVVRLDSDTTRSNRTAYLRRTVARKLGQAQKLLPREMKFVLRDAWRPVALQKKIMQEFIDRFLKNNPSWSIRRAKAEAEKYVADTKGEKASGHLTGGAVDVRLMIPMRSWKLTYQENSEPYQPKLPKYIQRNREIMYQVLRKVGFSQCHNEFWHWSYGDTHWARRTGEKVAIYGVVKKNNQ